MDFSKTEIDGVNVRSIPHHLSATAIVVVFNRLVMPVAQSPYPFLSNLFNCFYFEFLRMSLPYQIHITC